MRELGMTRFARIWKRRKKRMKDEGKLRRM